MSKYKAILCDDDEIIARGLSVCVPWDELGIEFCGYRNNGMDARALLDEVHPDILMSDIRMPFMDGLQLMEYAKRQDPDIRVVIFSGYDDFSYAQKAIRLGAMDYLLKPVNDQDLVSILKKAIQELDELRAAKDMKRDMEERAQLEQLKCLAFLGPEAYEQEFGRQLPANACPACHMVVIANIDAFEELRYAMVSEELNAIDRRFYDCLAQQAPALRMLDRSRGEMTGVFCAEDAREVGRLCTEAIHRFREAFRIVCPDRTVTFALSDVHSRPAEMHRSWQEAVLATGERFAHPAGSLIRFSERKSAGTLSDEELEQTISVSQLLLSVRQCDRERLAREIGTLKGMLSRAGRRARTLLHFCANNLFETLFQDLQRLDLSEERAGFTFLDAYEDVTAQMNIDAALDKLESYCEQVIAALESNSRTRNAQTIQEAVEYIEAHYQEHALSMDDVARAVHMSPSYFSVIFKRETGEAFTDCLIRLRIKKSIEMMRYTDLKVYEIATAVGYDTASYYSTAFKKETGYSPSEYKRTFIDQG